MFDKLSRNQVKMLFDLVSNRLTYLERIGSKNEAGMKTCEELLIALCDALAKSVPRY